MTDLTEIKEIFSEIKKINDILEISQENMLDVSFVEKKHDAYVDSVNRLVNKGLRIIDNLEREMELPL